MSGAARRVSVSGLAGAAAAVYAAHISNGFGKCRGCSTVLGKPVAWPCTFISLAELALKIAKGDIGER